MTQLLTPEIGGLYVPLPDDLSACSSPQQPLVFPLKHTDVRAQVSGNLARVEVTQIFENPFTTALEAIYVFPLPDQAAVDEMIIQICDRTLHGSIKKRLEAQQIYQQAKQRGQTAGLLEQERPNIFTQSLANIPPGESITVTLRYSDCLAYKNGEYEFVFPMVVGPRYIPGTPLDTPIDLTRQHGSAPGPMTLNQDTDLVPDAARLNPPILPAGVRSGHDISVTLEIQAGISLKNIQSPSHAIQVEYLQAADQNERVRVTLAPGDTVPNKDLIVRYPVQGSQIQTTVLTQADDRGGHFAVYFVPAIAYQPTDYVPKDMVFLIDTSGSQMGAPLMQCQALMRRFIEGLHPQDTFNIVDFSNTAQQLSKVPLTNTPRHRQQALRYIDRLNAGGGTEMMRGLNAALNLPLLAPSRLRTIVLLTDGYIGNENQILAAVQQQLKPGARLHSFGAGSSVNRFLLNRIAELGRGIAEVVRHDQPIDQVVDHFFEQINNPVLANIELQWQGAGTAPELYPAAPPDLFAEQPLVIFGRKLDAQPGTLQITATLANGARYCTEFTIPFAPGGNPAIAQLWGRARIKEIMNQMVSGETKVGVAAVTETALSYQLLSQYTAFVAVSDQPMASSYSPPISIQVPVNMPEGVAYEGVFGVDAGATSGMGVKRSRLSGQSPKMAGSAAPGISPAAPLSDLARSFSPESALFSETEAVDSEAFWPHALSDESPRQEEGATQKRSQKSEEQALTQSIQQAPLPVAPLGRRPAPEVTKAPPGLRIVQATGLTPEATWHLQALLDTVDVSTAISGTLVFELVLTAGRVKQIIFDTEASAEQSPEFMAEFRRILSAWRCPQPVTVSVHLELQC